MRIYPVTPPAARAVNAPEPPIPVTSSLPQYKVRGRDGSEIIIPTAEVLAHKVLNGEIRPDTVIFDAGRGTWCRAAEAPLVRFIVTEAGRDRPELAIAWPVEADALRSAPVKPLGQTELFSAGKEANPWPTVRQIDPMAGALQSTEAAPPRNAPHTPARNAETDLPRAIPAKPAQAASTEHRPAPPKPVSTASSEPRQAPAKPAAALETDPQTAHPNQASTVEVESRTSSAIVAHIEWDEWGNASIAEDLPAVPTPASIKRISAKKRARIFATSLVGGVAATVALGIFLQGETPANSVTITDPQASEGPPPQPYTFAENPAPTSTLPPAQTLGRAPAPQTPTRTEQLAPATADFPKFEPPRASRPIEMPVAPILADAQLVSTANLATASSPLLALPTPPRPTRGNENAPPPVTFTQPRVRNAARVQQSLERVYPIGLRELGIGGKVEMSFYINERGVVERFETKQSSGNPDLDKAALQVAEVFEFTPAMRGDEGVPVWFSMAITFGKAASVAPATPTNVVGAAPSSSPDQPVASQFDVAPQVRNANRVRQSLEREYPIGLRAAGVGGTVELWFYVDERGQAERFQLKKSSGNADLDQAALEVAQVFQFNPGTRGGTPAAGWISLGVAFAPDSGAR